MSVTLDIILISKAIQSNGILSYNLNILKTKYLLKSTQLFTRATLNEMRMPSLK